MKPDHLKTREELLAELAVLREQAAQHSGPDGHPFRQLAENNGSVFWAVDHHGRLTYISPSVLHLRGLTQEEAMAQSLDQAMTPQSLVLVVRRQQERLAAEERGEPLSAPSRMLLEFYRKDGTTVWVEAISQGLYNDDGRWIGSIGICHDASQRVNADAALRENRALLHSIIESLPFDFWACDNDGRYILLNSSTKRRWGVAFGQRPGDTKVPQEIVARWESSNARALAGQDVREEVRYDYGEVSGTYLNVLAPIRDGERVLGLVGANVDITAHKCAVEALERSEAFLHEIGTFARVGGWEHDLITRKAYWTKELRDIVEFEGGEPPGPDEHLEFYPPKDREALVQALGRAVAEGTPFDLELQGFTLKGRPLWVKIIGRAVHRDGQCVKLYGSLQDITERKRTEEALRSAREEARAGSRAKSEFLANMSHELRTPLSAILGLAELSLEKPGSANIAMNMDLILQSAKGLLSMVGDMLDLARAGAGRFVLERRPFSLAQTLRQAVAPLDRACRKKGLSLTLDIAPNVPEQVEGDPGRLGQVLASLAGNAVKFTSQGGVTILVGLDLQAPVGRVGLVCTVRDTGIGIAPEHREAVFEPFWQADSSFSKSYQGAGLGLAICRELTSLMGGRVWAESESGQGSVFHFTVLLDPVADSVLCNDSDSVGCPVSSPAPGPHAEDALPEIGRRVLVVEDNPINRLLFEEYLVAKGMEVKTAEDGQDALKALAREPFDLVLMDVQMAGMDGLEAVGRIRQGQCGSRASGLPVIALTAYAMDGDRERFLQAGMTDYLSKPVSLDDLWVCVSERLGLDAEGGEAGILDGVQEFHRPLLGDFLAFFEDTVASARACLEAGDLAGAGKAAHDIAGASMGFGMKETATLGTALVSACRNNAPPGAAEALAAVQKGVLALRAALANER